MIKVIDNFLSESEFSFFKEIINNPNFYADNKPFTPNGNSNIGNYYNRKFITPSDNIEKRICECLKLEYESLKFKISNCWINHIYVDTNKNDNFHKDHSPVSVVLFLNEGFIGGNLEYKDFNGDINIITPKENRLIIIDKKCRHRVRNVMEGNRYTFVAFLEFEKKISKTII
ncbi:MAG: hypothetical protein FJ375_04355 [Pelagibacterales bacterium]|nr:hypothetical protein [Pelagibacterales bacterium]